MPDLTVRFANVFLRIARRLSSRIEGLFYRHSLVSTTEFFDNSSFPWVKGMEANWQPVRQELDELLPYVDHLPNYKDISAGNSSLPNDDSWKAFVLYRFGQRSEANCQRCPKTAKLLSRIPGMESAFFSILRPGKHIPPHSGRHNGAIKCHLAVRIPEPASNCALRVGNETRHWKEGEILIFDDNFEHEAWNRCDQIRVILLIDIVRPLQFPVNLLNKLIRYVYTCGSGYKAAVDNHTEWEVKFDQVYGNDQH